MKKIKALFLPLLVVMAIGATTLSLYLFASRPKLAYVNLGRVYNEFELKKQLENQLTVVQQTRQKMLDSLELGLNVLSRNLQSMNAEKDAGYKTQALDFDARKQEYLYKQKSFSEDNATMTQQYSEQIWKQLNQYVKDYGDAHGYTYIIGGDGTGSVMYAAKGEDITDALVTYTNQRFKGETKAQ